MFQTNHFLKRFNQIFLTWPRFIHASIYTWLQSLRVEFSRNVRDNLLICWVESELWTLRVVVQKSSKNKPYLVWKNRIESLVSFSPQRPSLDEQKDTRNKQSLTYLSHYNYLLINIAVITLFWFVDFFFCRSRDHRTF